MALSKTTWRYLKHHLYWFLIKDTRKQCTINVFFCLEKTVISRLISPAKVGRKDWTIQGDWSQNYLKWVLCNTSCNTEVGKQVDPRCFWSRRSQRSHELNSIDGIGKLIEVNLQKFHHIVGNPFTWIIPRTTFVCWSWTLARYLAFEYYINTFGTLMVVCFSFSQMSCNAVPKTAFFFEFPRLRLRLPVA